MITTQILIQNNKKTIEKTLQSVLGLGQILIGDIGSTDGTVKICEDYGIKVVKFENRNYSTIRNSLTSSGLNLFLHPWEVLVDSDFTNINKIGAMNIFENNIVTKENRVWRGDEIRFTNPIFESLDYNDLGEIIGTIYSTGDPTNWKNNIEVCKNWVKSEPIKTKPYYYLAMSHLKTNNYKEFILAAHEYLIKDYTTNSATVLRYYLSQVYFLIEKNHEKAIQEILFCLAQQPLMAEYWCLLGDIYCDLKRFKKAISMYKNAMILGTRREKRDFFSVEINKYKEYPEKMIRTLTG